MAEEKEAKDSKEKKHEAAEKKEAAKDAPKEDAPKQKGKDKKEEKEPKKEKKEIKIQKKNLNLKPDFRYVVRIANTDIDGTRRVSYALTSIDGIGIRLAEAAVTTLGLPSSELLGNLSEEQIANIENTIQNVTKTVPSWLLNRRRDWEMGDNQHVYGGELRIKERDDINMMKMIRCYKGIRHESGQKVRGQRTKSNGRTGLTVGVTRKAALAAAKAAKDTEGGGREKGGGAKKEKAPATAAAPASKEEKK